MMVAKGLAKGSVDKNVCFHVRVIDNAKQTPVGTSPGVLTTSLWPIDVQITHLVARNGNAFDAAIGTFDDIGIREFFATQCPF